MMDDLTALDSLINADPILADDALLRRTAASALRGAAQLIPSEPAFVDYDLRFEGYDRMRAETAQVSGQLVALSDSAYTQVFFAEASERRGGSMTVSVNRLVGPLAVHVKLPDRSTGVLPRHSVSITSGPTDSLHLPLRDRPDAQEAMRSIYRALGLA